MFSYCSRIVTGLNQILITVIEFSSVVDSFDSPVTDFESILDVK